jgi:HD-like signal output (HDOD) protein
LRDRLRNYRQRWTMAFSSSAHDAISQMRNDPFDVIVSDMRMPEIDGAELLSWVKEHRPSMGRIALSGHTDRETAFRSLGVAHLTLSKPCELRTLERGIECAGRFHRLLSHPKLKEVVGSTDRLPSLPRVCIELRRVLADEAVSVDSVTSVVERDTALSAKLLQVVNSPIFGLRRSVNRVRDAISYLGTNLIQDLMVSLHALTVFKLPVGARLSMEMHRDHSMRTARIASALASIEQAPECFSAGLLHDVGNLLLHTQASEMVDELLEAAESADQPHYVLEREAWGVTHADVGAFLLGLWGLPDGIVQAVALHHSYAEVASTEVSRIVSIADALAHEQTGHQTEKQTEQTFAYDEAALQSLPEWRAKAARLHQGAD